MKTINKQSVQLFHSVVFLYLSTKLSIAKQNLSIGVNVVSSGVRVSGGHLYEVEAPTKAAAETSLTDSHSPSNLFRYNHTTQIVIPITSKASNKVHSGVKFSKFGNAVWFLLFVNKEKLYYLKLFLCCYSINWIHLESILITWNGPL